MCVQGGAMGTRVTGHYSSMRRPSPTYGRKNVNLIAKHERASYCNHTSKPMAGPLQSGPSCVAPFTGTINTATATTRARAPPPTIARLNLVY